MPPTAVARHLCEGPARSFGFRRKGRIVAGMDADLVVLNSVAQYFPSIDYLVRVLEGAARMVADGGAIFVGDVRSLPLLAAFHTGVELQRAPDSLPLAQLRQQLYPPTEKRFSVG